jgi:hypothetical protein
MGTNDHSPAFEFGSERRSGALDMKKILEKYQRRKNSNNSNNLL